MRRLPRPRRDRVDPNPWTLAEEEIDREFEARAAASRRVLSILPADGALLLSTKFYARATAETRHMARRTAEWQLREALRDGLAEVVHLPEAPREVYYRRVPRGEWMARWSAAWYPFDLNPEDHGEPVITRPLDPKREAAAGRFAGYLIKVLWRDEALELQALIRAQRTRATKGEDAALDEWHAWLLSRNNRADSRLSDFSVRNSLFGEDDVGQPVDPDVARRAATIALNFVATVVREGPRIRTRRVPGSAPERGTAVPGLGHPPTERKA